DNDMLRRSPGTPVFTAPECILDITYSGKAADTWAVGVTLYYSQYSDSTPKGSESAVEELDRRTTLQR
ncbi:putative serine/threonine-protein kinase, partial [Trifolium medium]|nr:putative serine/threonine-protein kinase [Trifolium medium]